MNGTNYESFKRELKDALKMEGYTFHEVTNVKNGIEMEGVAINFGESEDEENTCKVCPIFYYDNMFAIYEERGMYACLCTVNNSLSRFKTGNGLDINNYTDRNYVVNHVVKKAVNTAKNKVLLESAPHYNVCDLSVVYIVPISHPMGGNADYTVTYPLLDKVGITEAELEAAAERNMEEALEYGGYSLIDINERVISSLLSVVDTEEDAPAEIAYGLLEYTFGISKEAVEVAREGTLMGVEECESLSDLYASVLRMVKNGGKPRNYLVPPRKSLDEDRHLKMYVLDNGNKEGGFAALMCRKVLLSVACLFGKADLYVIPSSIHEAIIIPVWDNEPELDLEKIKADILSTNQDAVSERDFLSDNLYKFDCDTLTMSIVE